MAIGAIIFASLAIIASVGIVILAFISNYYTEQQVIDGCASGKGTYTVENEQKVCHYMGYAMDM